MSNNGPNNVVVVVIDFQGRQARGPVTQICTKNIDN